MNDAAATVGQIVWTDLTVPDASGVKDFYTAVVGWSTSAVDMSGYEDFCMNVPGTDQTVAGICHARGVNAELPPVWLIYINVSNLDESLQQCRDLGGEVLQEPRQMGGGLMAVIRDPAGAVSALFQPETAEATDG